MVYYLKEMVFVGTALVAVRFEVRTGIHPEGQALSLRNTSSQLNDFFNTPFMAC